MKPNIKQQGSGVSDQGSGTTTTHNGQQTSALRVHPLTRSPVHPFTFTWVLAVGVGAALLALLALVPLRDQRAALDVGARDAANEATTAPRSYGFFNAEAADGTVFRWTQGWARVVVPFGARLGATVQVDLRLCGCHPGTQPAVQLALDNQPLAMLPTSASYRRYTLLVVPHGDNPTSDRYLVLHTPTATLDGRPVGVRLAHIALTGQPTRALPGPQPLALACVGLAVAAIVTQRLRVAGDRTTRGALLALLVLGPALALVLYRRQELTPAALVLAELCGVLFVALARPPRGVALALAALVLALPFAPQLLGGWLVDDAFISFRYAQNLVNGHGLVFNPGERVEGYTNFLWTLIAAMILRLGGDPAQLTPLLTLLIGQAVVVLVYVVGGQGSGVRGQGSGASLNNGLWTHMIAPLLVATSAPFLLYTARGSGMETALFMLLLLAGVREVRGQGSEGSHQSPVSSLQSPVPSLHVLRSGALLALAAMTRPEGVLVAGVVGLYLLGVRGYTLRKTQNAKRKTQNAVPPALAFALGFLVLFAPYYLWRYSYYGLPLPNTFYAKVGASSAQLWRGAHYIADYWRAEGLAWALGLLVYFGFWIYDVRSQTRSIQNPKSKIQNGTIPAHLLIALVLVYTLYIAAVGGDWLPGWRFVVPLVPLYALLAQCGLRRLAARGRGGALVAAALLALALHDHARHTLATNVAAPDSQIAQENITVMRRREVGRWLRANTPPATLVAVEAAGALPYYSQRPAIDILGLNDRHIASVEVPTLGSGKPGHEKTDVPYVLDRQPDLIPYFSVPYLKTDPRFKQYVREQHEGPEGHDIILYRRK